MDEEENPQYELEACVKGAGLLRNYRKLEAAYFSSGLSVPHCLPISEPYLNSVILSRKLQIRVIHIPNNP